MSDKFKPWQDRRPKKFKGEGSSDFVDTRKGKSGTSKQDRKQRRDNTWKRDFLYR